MPRALVARSKRVVSAAEIIIYKKIIERKKNRFIDNRFYTEYFFGIDHKFLKNSTAFFCHLSNFDKIALKPTAFAIDMASWKSATLLLRSIIIWVCLSSLVYVRLSDVTALGILCYLLDFLACKLRPLIFGATDRQFSLFSVHFVGAPCAEDTYLCW